MKRRLSFRSLMMILFVAGMIPVLISVGLVVYRLQQGYLLRETERRLVRTVTSEVTQYASDRDLTVLAVSLASRCACWVPTSLSWMLRVRPCLRRSARDPG